MCDGDATHCVNGLPFDKNRYLHTVVMGEVAERQLRAIGNHPFHQHVYPFQIVDGVDGLLGTEPGDYFKKGDWHDVIMIEDLNDDITMRFKTTVHYGKIMIHCHRLDHEDKGMMAMEDVLDPNLTPNAACQCEANMARAPTDPTPSPSAVPTISTSPSATPTISSAPSTSNQPTKTWVRPNFIVMQPDDLDFFERWTPPVHFPTMGRTATMPASHVLSNMERLRTKGLHMKQAYTASSKVCSPQHPLALNGCIVSCFRFFFDCHV